jgi:LysM repeat protein
MLNKDQYNQEEYNNYYQQETQGAEISQGSGEPSGGKGAIFAVLGLVILGVGGYFGYTALSSGGDAPTDESLVVQHEVEPPATSIQVAEEEDVQESKKPAPSDAEEIVQNVATDNPKMSPEEIAKVVQMVMTQMNKNPEEVIEKVETKSESDTALISALSGTDVDSVSEEGNSDKSLEETLNSIEETQNTTIKQSSAKVDTYNKVNVESSSSTDELSQLSSQISSLMEENSEPVSKTSTSNSNKNYTESIKKEVVTRSNEMRVIVVKKGDTLGKIAKRAYGNVMEFKKIYRANPEILNRPDRIYIGQKLRIPK